MKDVKFFWSLIIGLVLLFCELTSSSASFYYKYQRGQNSSIFSEVFLMTGWSAERDSVCNALDKIKIEENEIPIVKGERPSVDFKNIESTSYYSGKIRIKLKSQLAKSMPELLEGTDRGWVVTGNSGLDSLNKRFSVEKYSALLLGFYNTNNKGEKYMSRHQEWGFHQWYDLNLSAEASVLEAVELFGMLPEVEVAEPLYKVEHYFKDVASDTEKSKGKRKRSNEIKLSKDNTWQPDDIFFNVHWPFYNTGQAGGISGKDIKMREAWTIEKGHPEVVVAVIDGGVDIVHPDLQANMWEDIGYNFSGNTSVIIPDPLGHGTLEAGTIAAVSNNSIGVSGVAGGSGLGDGVRIMTCQVFNPDYSAGGFEQAFLFAADQGAAIAQNSWGYSTQGVYNQAVLDAIDYFNQNAASEVLNGGITIFAAANNDSEGKFYPAYYSGTFAVSATNNKDLRSYYSNYGAHIDVSAPGGETNILEQSGVLSTLPAGQYGFKQGTSMAAPHVSGLAALLVSYAYRNQLFLSAQEVRGLIKDNCDEIYFGSNMSYYNKLGAGRINAFKALQDLSNKLEGLLNPENFSVQALSSSQIELSWMNDPVNPNVLLVSSLEPAFGQPEDGIFYQPGNHISGLGEVLYYGSASGFLHSGLLAATHYYYKVFSCSSSMQYSSGRNASAITLCETKNLPFFESFSSGLVPPVCWNLIDNDGDGNNWKVWRDPDEFYFVAGSQSRQQNSPLAPDNWLVLPRITVPSDNIVLRFWVKATDIFNYNEKYSVLVSELGNDNIADFTEVYTSTPGSNKWSEVSINIMGYKSKDVYIAFRHWDTVGLWELLLKNISIEPGKPGDVNGDSRVDVLDIVGMLRYLNDDIPEVFLLDAADINGDGVVDYADLHILRIQVMSEAY